MATRISLPYVGPIADANIQKRYPIEEAGWIWHPALAADEIAVVDFALTFSLEAAAKVTLHVSADQRYELSLDGERISRGPDRGDLLHWSFASYTVELAAGEHRFDARVMWLGDKAPCAQVSRRGGFILMAEGSPVPLDTGAADWLVAQVQGLDYGPALPGAYHVVGPAFIVDGAAYHAERSYVPAVEIARVNGNRTGIVNPNWQLEPSPLPEQIDGLLRPGTVRAVTDAAADATVPAAAESSPHIPAWQALVTDGAALTIPANTRVSMIWDLDDYFCGYVRATVSDGAGASLDWEWAESLYVPVAEGLPREKGDRNQVAGKRFRGFGDSFRPDGGAAREFASLWWRAGRFCRVTVQTADAPLTIQALVIDETRYPMENDGRFEAAPVDLGAIVPMAVRGIQMCSHETYMDCPYYEQLMYVGDTRLEVLTTYVMTADDRLPRRAVELFDWSRWHTGFVAERYPSHPYQLSLTFSMLWVSMLRDYAYWRDDAIWCRLRLTGARCLMEHFVHHGESEDGGLLRHLPGWSFVDWVPSFFGGVPTDGRDGLSAPINLLYIQALLHLADVEDACGEPAMAARWRDYAERASAALLRLFWDEERGLIADDLAHSAYSEHAQCLALINGLLSGEQEQRCLDGLLTAPDLARTTVYFSFYLLETYQRYGLGDELLAKMDFWQDLVAAGFKTPVESPEPSRSDCHAWGSHPLFHFHATMAGVRPASPGFQTVRIAPVLGPLTQVQSQIPHPKGEISVTLQREGDSLAAGITLPPGITGTFAYAGQELPLTSGDQTLTV